MCFMLWLKLVYGHKGIELLMIFNSTFIRIYKIIRLNQLFKGFRFINTF